MTQPINAEQIILVTGATGNQGGAIARPLLQRGKFKVCDQNKRPSPPTSRRRTRTGRFQRSRFTRSRFTRRLWRFFDPEFQRGSRVLIQQYQYPSSSTVCEMEVPALSEHWLNLPLGNPAQLTQKRDDQLRESIVQRGHSIFVPDGQPSYCGVRQVRLMRQCYTFT